MNTEQQKQRPARKKTAPTDIILMLLGILLLFRIPWNNMDSFYFLLLFLYILCIMLRISNLRKERMRQMAIEQRKAEAAAKTPEDTSSPETAESSAASETAENREPNE